MAEDQSHFRHARQEVTGEGLPEDAIHVQVAVPGDELGVQGMATMSFSQQQMVELSGDTREAALRTLQCIEEGRTGDITEEGLSAFWKLGVTLTPPTEDSEMDWSTFLGDKVHSGSRTTPKE
jgi:hypothetical protein